MFKIIETYKPGGIIFTGNDEPYVTSNEPYIILNQKHYNGLSCLSLYTLKINRYVSHDNIYLWKEWIVCEEETTININEEAINV